VEREGAGMVIKRIREAEVIEVAKAYAQMGGARKR
jgi:hypothetical protein